MQSLLLGLISVANMQSLLLKLHQIANMHAVTATGLDSLWVANMHAGFIQYS